jgi:hypothetical protein
MPNTFFEPKVLGVRVKLRYIVCVHGNAEEMLLGLGWTLKKYAQNFKLQSTL